MQFRNCFFEYDGVNSERYNLRLGYVENQTYDFDSGGNFDFKTGQIPYYHEQIYYGKDYSANPLQFEIEAVNPDGYITKKQIIEIKNWLFNKDGWKKFRLIDGNVNRSLRCVLIPIADITEGNHYRGLRFTLRSASPFWYGEEKEVVVNNPSSNYVYYNGLLFSSFNIEIPNDDSTDCVIMPKMLININKTSQSMSNVKEMNIVTTEATNIADGLAYETVDSKDIWDYPATSGISCDISYMGDNGSPTALDTIVVDTRYAVIESTNFPNTDVCLSVDANNPLQVLRLKRGTNICRVRYGQMYDSIVIKYTPLYRMGAF